MNYSKYPHAREYVSQRTGDKVCGLSVEDHAGCVTFFVFDEEEPYLTKESFDYNSSEAFEEEWSEATSHPSILLEGADVVELFRKWQSNGYFTPKREYVEALENCVKKLEEYNKSLERKNEASADYAKNLEAHIARLEAYSARVERENAVIYGKLMGVDIYPDRPDFKAEEV